LNALNKAIEEKDSQYQAKIDALSKIIEENNLHFAEKQNAFNELMNLCYKYQLC
jgi:nitrate reductase assembly molybdenum cofactor insertion protein NarJ